MTRWFPDRAGAVFMTPDRQPWWRRTRLGQRWTRRRNARAMRKWKPLGFIDEAGIRGQD